MKPFIDLLKASILIFIYIKKIVFQFLVLPNNIREILHETRLYFKYYFRENVLKGYTLNVMKCCSFRNVKNFQYVMNIVQTWLLKYNYLTEHFNLHFQKSINMKI